MDETAARRPSVLIVHQNAELYGADRVLLAAATALTASAVVRVVLPTSGPLVGELAAREIEVDIDPTLFVVRKAVLQPRSWPRAVVMVLRSTARLVRRIRRSEAKVVYVSTITVPTAIVAARLCRRHVVVHVHEAEPDQPRVVQRALLLPLLLSTTLIAISDDVARFVAGVYPRLRQRTVLVRNPIRPPAEPFAALPLERPAALRVIVVGRYSERKGSDLAIAAADLIARRGVPIELVMVGSVFPGNEEFERTLRDAAAASTVPVTFTGFVTDPDPWWRDAHVTLVPSRIEPYGLVAAESLLRGRITVAARRGGLPEIVEDGVTGRLVEPEAGALADSLEAAWSQWPKYVQLAAAGRHHREHSGAHSFAQQLRGALGFAP